MDIEERVSIARNAHKEGYNCTQAVICGYLDLFDIPKEEAMKMAYDLGRGVGGSFEICGTLTGGAMVLGEVLTDGKANPQTKKEIYDTVKQLVDEFEKKHHAVTCGELLGIKKTDKEVIKLPCRDMVEEVVRMLENYVI